MFSDLDESLKAILRDPKASDALRKAEISFQTPGRQFAATAATVNLFLHELKENRALRDPVPVLERVGDGYTQRTPPLRLDCTYLVTAWSAMDGEQKIADEHRLLGQALGWLSRFATIPVDKGYLKGVLANQPFPPPTMVAQADNGKTTAEFWNALGIPPRPCFSLVVTIAVDLAAEEEVVAPVVTKMMNIKRIDDRGRPVAHLASLFEIGGTVMNSAQEAVPDATVALVELRRSTTTDRDGRFRIEGIEAAGSYTLEVEKDGQSTSRTITVPQAREPGPPVPSRYDIILVP